MKSLIVVSLFGASALLGPRAGAQQMPTPYAPPSQLEQIPQPAPEAQGDGLALPTADEMPMPVGAESQQGYDPNSPNVLDYPPADLGPDDEIAQSYDDGYDAQAYTQFETALAPYGGWDYDSSYGYVWSPNVTIVGADFSPYATCGHWALTEYGWTWVSDWSWGWAPFHYGRWITRAGRWSWVPGSMWGPAWVSWRSGGGYVGWSPLPPRGVHLAGGYGAGSPWRFAPAASLGVTRPRFTSPRHLPGIFARTTVVSNDRLLTRGRWAVHINAGPTRGITARPVALSRVAPSVLPRVAVYPHRGLALSARPWIRTAEARRDVLTHGWHAGAPTVQPHTVGRAPGFGSSPTARAEVHAPSASWSQRPAPAYGSAAGHPHAFNSGWSAQSPAQSYGAPRGYGAESAYRPPAGGSRGPAPMPAYRAPGPAPAYHPPAYHPPTPSSSPAPRSFAPPSVPPSSGGFSHFGPPPGGGNHFGPPPGSGNHFGPPPGGGNHFGPPPGSGNHFGPPPGGGNHFGASGGSHFGGFGGGRRR